MAALVMMTVLVSLPAPPEGPRYTVPRTDFVSSAWELDFEFEDLRRIQFQHPGDSAPTTYWYMIYKVTNRTGKDVEFFPSFRLVTDTLDTVIAGDHVSPLIYEQIAQRHSGLFPFFVPPIRIMGKLLQGDANSRSSAAVFRTFDPNASSFRILVSGLSGAIERVNNPGFDASKPKSEDENPQFFVLRRTLVIAYNLPGDARTRALARPIRKSREWVMQ